MSTEPVKPVAGTKCQEAALGLPFYLPCGKPADFIVGWHRRTDEAIPMCWMCADHNVRNRGGKKLTEGEVTGAPLAEPPVVAQGSAEAARPAGDHETQDGG